MKIKKILLYSFVLLILFLLQSCDKKQEKKQTSWKRSKADRVLTDKYLDLADTLKKKSDYKKAYYYYYKAKTIAESKKDTSRVVYSLIQLTSMHYQQTDYTESETIATQALALLKNKKDLYYNYCLYMTLGNIYRDIYDYKIAQHYFEKALKFNNISSLELTKVKNNIASVYMAMNDYYKASQILKPLITKKELINNEAEYARVLGNLGYCYYKLGNTKALEYLNTSLHIRTKINDWATSLSYIYLSEYYQKQNPNKAYNYAELGYKSATKTHTQDNRLTCLKQLIEIDSKNKFKDYTYIYFTLNDSINKARQMAKNQFAKIKYDSKQDKEENLKLKAQKAENKLELEHQKNKNLISNFLIITGILSTIFLYCFLKAINKKEKTQTAYDTETRIAKKLHDELANDVYRTMAFAETQDLSSSQNKEILLTNLDTIYSRIRNISKENSSIDTGLHFVAGLKEMMSGFNTDAVTILINGMNSINWKALETNKKIIVYRVLQELLVNMKKHSHCSLVVITFKKIENKLQIDYSDNGLGVSFYKINSKNGLQNVENRILAINGTITFDTKPDKGFKTSFIIPL